MDNPLPPVKGWQQRSMLPPEVIEATLSVGIVASSDHFQIQVEVRDPSSGELLSLFSMPSVRREARHIALDDMFKRLRDAIEELSVPF